MSDRQCQFLICNNTTITWYRRRHELKNGTWLKVPTECIRPGSRFTFCFAATPKVLKRFIGTIEYGLLLDGLEYYFSFCFNCPFMGLATYKASLSVNQEYYKRNFHKPDDIFVLNENIQNDTLQTALFKGRFTLALTETDFGSKFIEELRSNMVRKLSEYCASRLDINQKPIPQHTIPIDFSWNVKNINWKRRLREAHQSIFVRVVNLTKHTLQLASVNDCNSQLLEGIWIEFPSLAIPSLCCTEFGCQSVGLFTGTRGSCSYFIPEISVHFSLIWHQPGLGVLNFEHYCSCPEFSITQHSEILNEATIVLHIVDSSNIPKIQLLSARMLASGLLVKVDTSKIDEKAMKSFKNKGIDVLSALMHTLTIEHTESSQYSSQRKKILNTKRKAIICHSSTIKFYESDMLLDKIHLTSPRAFLSSAEARGLIPSIISKRIFLYLNWRIGCERYCYIWGPDEPVSIIPSIISGLDKKQFALTADVLPRKMMFCEIAFQLNSKSADEFKSLLNYLNKEKYSATIDEMLEGVFECCELFCQGLQPVILEIIQKKYPNTWLEESGLPLHHIWRVGNKDTLDFEGLLHLMMIFWNELFLTKVVDVEPLHIMQKVAIFWSNQELSKFDAPTTKAFMKAASFLLLKFDCLTQSNAINEICQDLFDVADTEDIYV